ncbi:protease inhibitor I42 family protein [Algoriphagus namhaensis]
MDFFKIKSGISTLGIAILLLNCAPEPVQKEVINIKSGEKFQIELPSNRSTGYTWEWTSKNENTSLDSLGIIYEVTNTKSVGEVGIELWTFRGNKVGQENLRLELKRQRGEKEASQIRLYEINISEN